MNSEVKLLDFKEFVKKIKNVVTENINSKFIFFLGAGSSASSDIPLAAELVRKWLSRLLEQKYGNKTQYSIDEIRKIVPDYDDTIASKYYGKVFELLFPTAEERQREIEKITKGKNPGFGYGILASLISDINFGRNFNVILTVNFDDLIADALYLFTNEKPLVILHECLANFAEVLPRRPLIVKLHGDAKINPKNVEEETKELSEEYKEVMRNILSESGLIFVGYGGNDWSISSILEELPEESIPLGVYWVGNQIPETKVGDFVRRRKGYHIKPREFDELMLYFLDEFSLALPDSRRYSIVLDDFYRKMNFIRSNLNLTKKSDRIEEIEELYDLVVNRIITNANSWHSIVYEASKWYETDLERADLIFSEGMKKFPYEPFLFGNYALFLHLHLNDNMRAVEIYERAILLAPYNAEILNNYAIFIQKQLEDYTKMYRVEDMLKKAIEIKPNDPSKLVNYASFLHEIRREYDDAEEYYLRAIDSDPEHVNSLGNYALFLVNIRQNYSLAEDYYRKALLLDPNHVDHLSNFALYHINILKSYELAEEFLEKAIEIEPNNCKVLRKYARFLWKTKEDIDEAEGIYKKIEAINPSDIYCLSNYAIFLIQERNNVQEAEIYLKRAIEINPKNPQIIDTYATFLCKVKMDYDVAETYLLTALEMEPNNPRILDTYGLFLVKYRKNIDEAEKSFIQALKLSPRNPNILANHAYVLFLKQDYNKAEEYYMRSIKYDPTDANSICALAGLLLARGNNEGFEYLDKARTLPKDKEIEGAINLEMNYYIVVYGRNKTEIHDSLVHIKDLLNKGIRSHDWDFSYHINKLKEVSSKKIEFVEELGEVILGKHDLEELEKYSIWSSL